MLQSSLKVPHQSTANLMGQEQQLLVSLSICGSILDQEREADRKAIVMTDNLFVRIGGLFYRTIRINHKRRLVKLF